MPKYFTKLTQSESTSFLIRIIYFVIRSISFHQKEVNNKHQHGSKHGKQELAARPFIDGQQFGEKPPGGQERVQGREETAANPVTSTNQPSDSHVDRQSVDGQNGRPYCITLASF